MYVYFISITLDCCQWLKYVVCSANYVKSSTFTLVYKIHFDVNRPLVYEWGARLVSRVPLNLYFNISPIQLHNYWIFCRLKWQVHVKERGTSGVIIILPPFAKFDLNDIALDCCQWLKSLVCSANYVESSTFKLVYKVHFDVNRPLVYEWGACLVSRVPLKFVFQYFSKYPVT